MFFFHFAAFMLFLEEFLFKQCCVICKCLIAAMVFKPFTFMWARQQISMFYKEAIPKKARAQVVSTNVQKHMFRFK